MPRVPQNTHADETDSMKLSMKKQVMTTVFHDQAVYSGNNRHKQLDTCTWMFIELSDSPTHRRSLDESGECI